MSTQVTLTLPDEVYRRAERLAQLSSREVAERSSGTGAPTGRKRDVGQRYCKADRTLENPLKINRVEQI